MLTMHGNQPALIGSGMAIELTVDARTGRRRTINSIPVIQVLCSVLPGDVDSPMIIFKECLTRSYSYALTVAKRTAHETDTVYVTISHAGIEKNGGNWGSMSYPIHIALESIVEAWDQAMQSGTPIDLSQGALEMVCVYTLGHYGPLPTEPAMMGCMDWQRDDDNDDNVDNALYTISSEKCRAFFKCVPNRSSDFQQNPSWSYYLIDPENDEI